MATDGHTAFEASMRAAEAAGADQFAFHPLIFMDTTKILPPAERATGEGRES